MIQKKNRRIKNGNRLHWAKIPTRSAEVKGIYICYRPSEKYCELYKMYEGPAKNNGVIFIHIRHDWMLFIVNAENHIALNERIKQTKELIESKGGITDIYTLLLCEKDLYPLRII